MGPLNGRLLAGLGVGAIGAGAGVAAMRLLRRHPPGGSQRWERTNYRGSTVSLLGGPAAATGVLAGSAVAMSVPRLSPGVPTASAAVGTIAASALVGLYDDLAGTTESKGFRGHLGALTRGEVTSGAIKIVVITSGGLLIGAATSSNPVDAVVAGGVVAGTANFINLLDLRPGRAMKVCGAVSDPLMLTAAAPMAGAVLGPVLALGAADLREETMLGDCGANALGAALGVALVQGLNRPARVLTLLTLAALTATSEKVSFTKVIETTPVLREMDRLGRVG